MSAELFSRSVNDLSHHDRGFVLSVLLHSFTSHIQGKNARARVYDDKVEWERPRGVSGAKVTAGIITMGVSFLATGVKNGKSGSEMIPIKNISSVVVNRDGLLNSVVQFITSGNTVDFRVSHGEAEIVRGLVSRLILGEHVEPFNFGVPQVATQQEFAEVPVPPAPVPPVVAATPPTGANPVLEQIRALADLKDAGVLTSEEFDAKKKELLTRL